MLTVGQPERKIRPIWRIFSSLKSQISASKFPASENLPGKNVLVSTHTLRIITAYMEQMTIFYYFWLHLDAVHLAILNSIMPFTPDIGVGQRPRE
jgi:hypothetical protein